MRRLALWLLAAVLGVAIWPPVGLAPLAFVALAPLVAALDGLSARRAFALAWLQATASALVVCRWFAPALGSEFGVPWLPAWLFTLALVGSVALAPALAAALFAARSRDLGAVAAPLVFAALFGLSEWGRSVALGAPWLLLAHSLAGHPLWLQTASLGGAWLPGFVLAASGAGVGVALVRHAPRAMGIPALGVALAGAYGLAVLARHPVDAAPRGDGLRVAVVQASIPQADRFQPGSALRNTRAHAELTRAVVARDAPDLVIWSETAVDDDLDASPALRAELEALVRELGVPLLTGAPREIAARPVNAAVLVTPAGGLVASYAKQRLVPIAEGEPRWLAWLAPLIPKVAEGEPYAAGREATVFRGVGPPFAAPICFEITYPALLREFRAAGAEWIVNLSNDVWFGPAGYPELHLAHAVLRAIELRSWLVRGANTGISAAIDPQGRIVARIPVFEDGSLLARIAPARPPGPYARFGDGPVVALLALAAAGPLLGASARRAEPNRPA